MADIRVRELKDYEAVDGKKPFREWFDRLLERDPGAAAKIATYLTRVKLGNLGHAKLLPGCGGVWELVMDFGPGWRIYFAQAGTAILLLIWGGNKRTQKKDIITAVKYWLEFKQRNRGKT